MRGHGIRNCEQRGDDGALCGQTIDYDSGLELCAGHLLVAYDWVSREVGVTDVLPTPCLACGSRLGVRYPSGWLCAICEWRVGSLPDDEALPTRVDVVYYVRFDDRIKIGTSGNPRQRLAQLRFDELLAFEQGDRLVEQRRHRQFAARRLGTGEWFAADETLLAHIDALAAGVDDPWARHQRWVSEAIARRA